MFRKILAMALVCLISAPIHAERDGENSAHKQLQEMRLKKKKRKAAEKAASEAKIKQVPGSDAVILVPPSESLYGSSEIQEEPKKEKKSWLKKFRKVLFFIPKARDRKDRSQEIEDRQAKILADEIARKNQGTDLVDDGADVGEVPESLYGDEEIVVNQSGKGNFGNEETKEAPVLGLTEDNEVVTDEINNAIEQNKRIVIVIDKGIRSKKNKNGQTLQVWMDGSWVRDFDVSTGREKQETSTSGKNYFTATPMRVMSIYRMTPLHYSKTWDAEMPHAMFMKWNVRGGGAKFSGIAIHASPTHEDQLGQRASGGCIRLSSKNAKDLYYLVKSVGMNNVTVIVHNDGQIRY